MQRKQARENAFILIFESVFKKDETAEAEEVQRQMDEADAVQAVEMRQDEIFVEDLM